MKVAIINNKVRILQYIIFCALFTSAMVLPVQAGRDREHEKEDEADEDRYTTRVVASGLLSPTGIAAQGNRVLYITQVPTPGVGGSAGGMNSVDAIDLKSGHLVHLTQGEPEPVHLALDKKKTLFWTCKSAGVILQRTRQGQVSLFLGGLDHPSGIAAGRHGIIYFTQVPHPGVPGTMGGQNSVQATDGVDRLALSMGEPEPADIAVAKDGHLYWTCKTAGVILERSPQGQISLFLSGLNSPNGIALDKEEEHLYVTEVPTPGLPGSAGGLNRVLKIDLESKMIKIVNAGDPYPNDVAVAPNGNIYWTCTSAGVVVEASPIEDEDDEDAEQE